MAAAVIVGFGSCVYFAREIFDVLAEPLKTILPDGSSMIYIKPQEAFFVYLKVAFIAGLLLVLPYLIYQLWLFVAPGLLKKERKNALPSIVIATLLFYGGASFAYFVVFPAAFTFFITFPTPDLKPMISMAEYVSLALTLMLAFGSVFETPVVIIFLGLLGIVDSKMLKKGRRYFIVVAFILAAILTPTPDPLNQAFMAIPMLLFYEISLRVLSVIEKRKAREEERRERELFESDDEDDEDDDVEDAPRSS